MPRLSFSLRDVFWLTLVVGMGCAWWAEHRAASDRANWQWRATKLKEAFEVRERGKVTFDDRGFEWRVDDDNWQRWDRPTLKNHRITNSANSR